MAPADKPSAVAATMMLTTPSDDENDVATLERKLAKAKEKQEAERKAKEEARAKEEAAQEAERKAKEEARAIEAERKAKEKARAKEEAAQKAEGHGMGNCIVAHCGSSPASSYTGLRGWVPTRMHNNLTTRLLGGCVPGQKRLR
jgi:hypothetical protein